MAQAANKAAVYSVYIFFFFGHIAGIVLAE
jgi:hypothetical protein